MTPEEIDRRVMAGRRDLHRWKRISRRAERGRSAFFGAEPGARDKEAEMAAAQIDAELGALKGLAEEARRIGRPEKAAKIERLVARFGG